MQKMNRMDSQRMDDFKKCHSLNEALNLVRPLVHPKAFYQHYTTLERVLDKIAGEWWLTRSDGVRLNDQQECVKYGKCSLSKRCYQASFCEERKENVAMWALYQHNNPLAIRVTIPGETMGKWMDEIFINCKTTQLDYKRKVTKLGLKGAVDAVSFGDVIYMSVEDPDEEPDELTIRRSKTISWRSERIKLAESLMEDVKNDWVTACVKDVAWQHENESRLIVRMKKTSSQKNSVKISIPQYVIEDMRFTFSPWLMKRNEGDVKAVLEKALAKAGVSEKVEFQRFRRSTLQGGLNFKVGESEVDMFALLRRIGVKG